MFAEDLNELRSVPETYFFVLNIDANFDCSSGYASYLDSQFNLRQQLMDPGVRNFHFWDQDISNNRVGNVILIGRVIVVVTRENPTDTISLDRLDMCIENIKKVCDSHHIAFIAYPHIGYDNGITKDSLISLFNKHFTYNPLDNNAVNCITLPLNISN